MSKASIGEDEPNHPLLSRRSSVTNYSKPTFLVSRNLNGPYQQMMLVPS